MSILPFRPKAPEAAIRLSDAMDNLLPAWIPAEGYVALAIRKPKPGELFYDKVRDKILRCVTDIETQAFVILEYKGGPE